MSVISYYELIMVWVTVSHIICYSSIFIGGYRTTQGYLYFSRGHVLMVHQQQLIEFWVCVQLSVLKLVLLQVVKKFNDTANLNMLLRKERHKYNIKGVWHKYTSLMCTCLTCNKYSAQGPISAKYQFSCPAVISVIIISTKSFQ